MFDDAHAAGTDAPSPAAEVPAFPGAEGFGATTRGGRGGKVLLVTTLDDYIPGRKPPVPGSLRAACEAQGPRTVVFRVSGTIPLKTGLSIREPHLTLAGQSAPGGGICVKNYGVTIRTHDVIVRYLRFRPGDESGKPQDALSVYEAQNVIVDHCSTSWASDETLSVTGDGCTNVTVQWFLISESLNDSVHPKGRHGYGSLIRANGNLSFHRNIYAHHSSRCPRPGTYGAGNVQSEQDIGERRDVIAKATAQTMADRPFATAPVATDPAEVAFQALLRDCGATLPRRDAADGRVIEQIRRGTGDLIDSQRDVGGWPDLASSPPPADADQDGLPDDWERRHGLDPADRNDQAGDRDGDGYTDIEEFLNGTDPAGRP